MVIGSCAKEEATKINDKLSHFSYPGETGSSGASTVVTNSNHLLIGGENIGPIVFKTSTSGDELWLTELPDLYFPTANSLIESPSRDIFVCGTQLGGGVSVVKLNPDGDEQWAKTYSSADLSTGERMTHGEYGEILILGRTSTPTGPQKLSIMSIDSAGSLMWDKQFPSPGGEIPSGLLTLSDGNYLIVSTSLLFGTFKKEAHFIAIDKHGDIQWEKYYERGDYNVQSAIEDSEGNIITCGYMGLNDTDTDLLLLKTDLNGNEIWTREYGDSRYSEFGYVIDISQNGDYIIGGTIIDHRNSKNNGLMLLKVSKDGDLIWERYYEGSGYSFIANLIVDDQDFIHFTGNMSTNIFSARLDQNGDAVD
jgi:hypothetical protein